MIPKFIKNMEPWVEINETADVYERIVITFHDGSKVTFDNVEIMNFDKNTLNMQVRLADDSIMYYSGRYLQTVQFYKETVDG